MSCHYCVTRHNSLCTTVQQTLFYHNTISSSVFCVSCKQPFLKKIVKSCERLKMIAKYNNTKSFISKQNGYYRLEIILLRVNKPNTICIIRRALTFLISPHVLSINKAWKVDITPCEWSPFAGVNEHQFCENGKIMSGQKSYSY